MTNLAAPPAPAPTDLATLADALLAAVATALDATTNPAPERRYVTTGQPTGECGALIVTWGRVGFGPPAFAAGPARLQVNNVRSAELIVWLWRCLQGVPVGQGRRQAIAPSPSSLSADGHAAMTDAVTMHRAVAAARRAGTFGDFAREMSVGDAVPVQPDGGTAAVMMPVTVQLS
jgi:hypothetical protein